MTARAKGLRQIENAQWLQGEYGCLNLHVHTPRAMPSMGIDPYDKKRGYSGGKDQRDSKRQFE